MMRTDACDGEEEDHSDDEVILEAGNECDLQTNRTISIVGDNFDTSIKPRDMRIDRQTKSLHLFHVCAAVARVSTLHLDDQKSLGDLQKVPLSAYLPSIADCAAIHDNYVILAARVIVNNCATFSSLRNCLPDHIQHEFSDEMKQECSSKYH